jgi:hypothetical protein
MLVSTWYCRLVVGLEEVVHYVRTGTPMRQQQTTSSIELNSSFVIGCVPVSVLRVLSKNINLQPKFFKYQRTTEVFLHAVVFKVPEAWHTYHRVETDAYRLPTGISYRYYYEYSYKPPKTHKFGISTGARSN